MPSYSPAFARVYNLRWSGFARQLAPRLLAFYAGTPAGLARQPVLDLGCGTGQLAQAFLEQGYPVTGLDLSDGMLRIAAANAAPYVASGRARFVAGDAADFTLDQSFGLVVATYDALNHLADLERLRSCFQSVAAVLPIGGHLIFDLNTRAGLQRWNGINLEDSDEVMVVTRGIFDGGERAWVKISGFVRGADGHYERFDETMFNTVFAIAAVLHSLRELGWSAAHAAQISDLATPLADPEQEGRVFIVARR